MKLYIGIAIPQEKLDLGISKAIELALIDSPSPFIEVIYYKYTLSQDIKIICDEFLRDSKDSDYRSFITETSNNLIDTDDYFNKQLHKNVICFSVGASSNILSEILTNYAITYMYFNKNLIKSFYIIFKSFNVKYIAVFYDPNTQYSIYEKDLIQQFKIQSKLLNIPTKFISLTNNNYILFPNTAIYMICNSINLNKFVNKTFLQKIRYNSFIALGDISENTRDIFENIPAFILYPWPSDFTSTSFKIYQYVNLKYSTYEIYPSYQILYSLSKITLNNDFFSKPFTLEEFVSFNAFTTQPSPWLFSNGGIDTETKGPYFGFYSSIFVKNIFFKNKEELYYKNFLGGNPSTIDSFSVFCRVGIVPFTVSNIFLEYNIPIYIYKYKYLVLIQNSSDTCELNHLKLTENGNYNFTKFQYQYDINNFFTILNFIPLQKVVDNSMSILFQCYQIE